MPPEERLQSTLAALARRLRWLGTETAAVTFAVGGVVAALAMLLAYKAAAAPALYVGLGVAVLVVGEAGLVAYHFRRRRDTRFGMVLVALALVGAAAMYVVSDALWLPSPWIALGVAIGLSVVAGALWGAFRPISLRQAAAVADTRLGLKERLSSAVAFAHAGSASPLVPALIEDAADRAAGITPRDVAPHALPRRSRHLAIAVVALVAASFVPSDLFRTAGELAVRRTMRTEGRRLQEEARRLEKDAQKGNTKTASALAKKLAELGKQFERAKLQKKQALLQSGDLLDQLRQQQKRLNEEQTPRSLAQAAEALRQTPMQSEAGRSLAAALARQDTAAAQKELEDLQKKLEQNQLSAAERQKLAQDLAKMASALDQSPLKAAAQSLSAASQAMQANQQAAAAQALSEAAKQASQAAGQNADAKALEDTIKQLESTQKQLQDADQPCPECGGGG